VTFGGALRDLLVWEIDMAALQENTEQLLERVARGEREARGALLLRHRHRLRQMIALRLDSRLAARIDPSDVVQDSLAEADRKLDDYAQCRPLPFYPWLRRIACEQLIAVHRRHLHGRGRTVLAEAAGPALPDESALLLADRLAALGSSPSARVERDEQRRRVRAALALLSDADREVLALRYLEDLPTRDVAAVLGLSESAVKMRQLRALQRLRDQLGQDEGESS
jgi:RNA polymerase sigma-70 factor (ECF subfamily)